MLAIKSKKLINKRLLFRAAYFSSNEAAENPYEMPPLYDTNQPESQLPESDQQALLGMTEFSKSLELYRQRNYL